MTISEILTGGGGILLIAMTLVQVAPIKISPWSAIARAIGKALNGDVMDKLDEIEASSTETRRVLDEHIRKDDERTADGTRQRILRFNDELIRGIRHTKEHYIEILHDIDQYKRYCSTNPNYENSRAVHSIANIGRVYDALLKDNDFL